MGEGTFGVVHKAVWRGTVVAAKIINVPSGTEPGVIKEIEMSRCVLICDTVLPHESIVSFLCRMVQHPNILCMLGSVVKDKKIAIISNLVRGFNLHELIFCSSTKVYLVSTCYSNSKVINHIS